MNAREACIPYINKYGTFNQTPNEEEQNSGNSLLYYGEYIEILNEYGELTDYDKENFIKVIRNYYNKSGLLNRRPGDSTERQAHDDYEGVLSAASILSPEIANEIMVYLQEHHFNADNVKPDHIDEEDVKLRNWFGRHFGFVAHVYFSNKKKPSVFERIRWIISIFSNARKKDGMSGVILSWLKIKTYERCGFNLLFCALVSKYWKLKLRKQIPEMMGNVFGQYFNSGHPFAVLMKDRV